MNTLVVVNPHSANSSTAREWPSISKALNRALGTVQEKFTNGQGHATKIVREGLQDGIERIIAIGGDGTTNEIVNGFFADGKPINPDALLGFIPRGTGGDLRKTLGIGRKLVDCIPVLKRSNHTPVDVGLTTFHDSNGTKIKRHFINITSFGIGGLVDSLVNKSSKALGGKASFLVATLRAMFEYKNKTVRLRVDDKFDEIVKINNIAVANGQYFGGGMWVAPEAKMDDGLFDVVIMGDFSKLDLILDGTKIYKGKHLQSPKVASLRGSHIEAECDEEVLIDMDGEQPGRLPITFDLLPKALKLIIP